MSETRAVTPLDQLRRQFNIPGIAEVHAGRGGLPVVRVTSPLATGEMYLHGGHVTSWVPAGSDEVLFVSAHARFEDGRAIRGGVPVCYPWFGALDGRSDAPAHGCVRTKAWQLDAVEQTSTGVVVTMSTTSDDHSRAYWPGDFRVVHRVTFGTLLTMELTTTNSGTTAFELQEALHTYYRVGSIHDVRIDGLHGLSYLDALDARRERRQDGVITFASEVDRIYLGTGTPITIDDGSLNRRIRINTEHSRTTVVWNPWIRKSQALADLGDDEWRHFVCVESCNVRPSAVSIGPGERHVMRAVVEVG
jgi:glucose-6-phosphate 1-epimerase